MLKLAAMTHDFVSVADGDETFTTITDKDTLPFAWSQLNANRKPL